jgi:hypothetical protein
VARRSAFALGVVLALSLFVVRSEARASASSCLGQSEPTAVMQHGLGSKAPPGTLAYRFRFGGCAPLTEASGLLFDLTSIQAGLQVDLTPVYVLPGGYLTFTPLSFVQLHLEAAPWFWWPIGLDGVGYFPVDGYSADVDPDLLPSDEAEPVVGLYARGALTLRAALPLGPLRLLVNDDVAVEWFAVGAGAYYYNPRREMVAARSDLFITNEGWLLLEFSPHPNVAVRLGATDWTMFNPASGGLNNELQGVLWVKLARLGPSLRDAGIVLRLGGRTNHVDVPPGFVAKLGIGFDVDLFARRRAKQGS